MHVQNFRNLIVWQRARELTKSVYEATGRFPQSEQFGLSAQMRRASLSICSNIAEGCGREGQRELKRFLHIAMGSACELESALTISCDLALIGVSDQRRMTAALFEAKRMLGGLITSVSATRGRRPTPTGIRPILKTEN